jgi:hypothetical protein
MTHLQQASIVPKKHILDNEVSEATKAIIKDKYKMLIELVIEQWLQKVVVIWWLLNLWAAISSVAKNLCGLKFLDSNI